MAESNPDIQAGGQHYLVCNTEGCKKSCQFYCNACHQEMCQECRDKHQKNPDTKNHEVVLYRQRKRQLPKEKCKNHPTKYIDMHCYDCNIPLCSQCCTMQNHLRHKLVDLETIYTDNCVECQEKIRQIYQYFIPTSEELKQETKTDTTEIKKTMDEIRASIKAERERLKRLVEEVANEKIEGVNKIEKSLVKTLQDDEKTYQDYISYLNEVVKEFHGYLSSTQLTGNPLISAISEKFIIKSIPQTAKPVPLVLAFNLGHYSKEEIDKLLGTVNVPNSTPATRTIKPMETVSPQLKQTKQDGKKSDVKQTLSLSSSVTKVREYRIPGVENVHHVSLGQSGRLWVSDDNGNLVQTDLQGNLLQKIETSGTFEGYHTVTQNEDLIYADQNKNVINKVTMDKKITKFIKTGDWQPLSIYCSRLSEDILVGMIKGGEAKVTRYNNTGKEIQNIHWNNEGVKLFRYHQYITENINGDICISDFGSNQVHVVNTSGQHRFSYPGQGPNFYPFGICTDVLGHIIVSDSHYENNRVEILHQNGQFLRFILAEQKNLNPRSVCVDDENNLHVGQYLSNTVTVFKYLK